MTSYSSQSPHSPSSSHLQLPLLSVAQVTKSFALNQERKKSLKELLIYLPFFLFKYPFKKPEHRDLKSNRQIILQTLSFDVYPGEFVGIIGHNGAGKSTILKIISGIYYPDDGEVKLRGKIAPLLELGAGFTDQLTGLDNIYLNSAILGMTSKELEQQLSSIIEFADLGEKLHMPVRHYSSGMIVRLAFSIAVHLNADLLLFDEVLAVGDQHFQRKCIEKIQQLHQLGKAIILVTHSQEIIERYCNRCIIIGSQKKLFDGLPKEAMTFYRQQ